MIKAIGEKDGKPLIIAGLSAQNVRNLRKKRPILFSMAIDKKPLEVLIMYGETEADIIAELKSVGVRLPTVPIEEEENLKKHVQG
jgi:hypothetical protein